MGAKVNTKSKIIEEAIHLFNKKGFSAISIQDIANELKVNRRNIAYHFSTKEALLAIISNEMWEKLSIERTKRKDFPSFENLTNEIKLYLHFQEEYAFIFNDPHIIQHPLVEEKFRTFCTESIAANEAAIAFAIKLGNMNPEPFAGAYHNLCLAIWGLSLYWKPQQMIRKVTDKAEATRVIWSLILPHFTPKGIESFKAFYGEEFFNSLGKPFNVNLDLPFF